MVADDDSRLLDAWRVLSLEPTASLDEARRVYRLRSRVLHPDRHQGAAPEVLAEAERAMKELTAAWTTIQRAGSRDGSNPSRSDASATALTLDECVDWFIGAFIEAGYAADDPVSPDDVRLALEPIATAARQSSFESWRQRRVRTLAIALAADQAQSDQIPREWQTYYDQLSGADTDVVLLLLLDQVLEGTGLDT